LRSIGRVLHDEFAQAELGGVELFDTDPDLLNCYMQKKGNPEISCKRWFGEHRLSTGLENSRYLLQ